MSTAIWVTATVLLTALFDVVLPLPSSWAVFPLLVLGGISAGLYADFAPSTFNYLARDFNRGVVLGLASAGAITVLTVVVFPQWTLELVVYSCLFYWMNATLRTAFSATSYLFKESVGSGKRILQAYAVSRLSFFAATPIILISLENPDTAEIVMLAVVWLLSMGHNFVWIGIGFPYPILRYLKASRNVELEILVLKTLREESLTLNRLCQRVRSTPHELTPMLHDMGRRLLVSRDGKRWILGPYHRGTLLLLSRRRMPPTRGGDLPIELRKGTVPKSTGSGGPRGRRKTN